MTPSSGRQARLLFTFLAAVGLGGCDTLTTSGCDTADTSCDTTDADADGYTATVDCDDGNAAINPGAAEVCEDLLDNDCDYATDLDDSDCTTG